MLEKRFDVSAGSVGDRLLSRLTRYYHFSVERLGVRGRNDVRLPVRVSAGQDERVSEHAGVLSVCDIPPREESAAALRGLKKNKTHTHRLPDLF